MSHEITAMIVLAMMIALNGFFSLSEMAVVSSRRQRLKAKADMGHASYRAVLNLSDNPTAFLSTIQIGITLIGILAGAYGEETIAGSLRYSLSGNPWFAGYANILSTGIVVVTITFVTILFGELIPKRFALGHPERIASLIVFPMKFISLIFLPLVRFMTVITNFIMDIMQKRDGGGSEPPVTEEEIKVLIKEGESFGLFKKQQTEMVEGVIGLQEYKITSIMRPRPEIACLELGRSSKKMKDAIIKNSHYSYLPVCENGLDHIVGVLKTRDALSKIINGKFVSIKQLIEKPLYAPESVSPLKLLELFKSHKTHIAFVLDEYGGVMGLVTLHDVVEEIVGEVPEESDGEDRKIIRRKDGTFLVDGMISLDDFSGHFPIEVPENCIYNTLAGFVMGRLGRVPRTGDIIESGDYSFEIVDMDGNRIDKILLKKMK